MDTLTQILQDYDLTAMRARLNDVCGTSSNLTLPELQEIRAMIERLATAQNAKPRYVRYIVQYTFDDGLTGKFWRYSLEGARKFIDKNKPTTWTLWGENNNGYQFALDNWRAYLN